MTDTVIQAEDKLANELTLKSDCGLAHCTDSIFILYPRTMSLEGEIITLISHRNDPLMGRFVWLKCKMWYQETSTIFYFYNGKKLRYFSLEGKNLYKRIDVAN